MGSWTGEGRDTISWGGTIKAYNLIGDVSESTINGAKLVPYTGAVQNVDLNNKNLTTTKGTVTASYASITSGALFNGTITLRQDGAAPIPINIINANLGANRYSELMFSYPGDLATAGIRAYATDLISNLKSQLRFFTSTAAGTKTERMTIKDEGSVGIARTDPTYLLDIWAGASTTNGLRVDGNRPVIIKADGMIDWYGASVGGWINSYNFKTNTGTDLTQFGVYGSDPTTLGYFYIGPAWDTPWMVIKSIGNVGINTKTPQSTLEVNGTIASSGAITASGAITTYSNLVVSGAITSTLGVNNLAMPYGCFSDSTSQAIVSTTASQAILLDTDEHKYRINHSTTASTSSMAITEAGTYLVTFSAIARAETPGRTLEIWFAKNGNAIERSNTLSKFVGANSERLITVTFIETFAVNDYLQLYMIGSGTDVTLVATNPGASPTRPASPSIITTINKIGA